MECQYVQSLSNRHPSSGSGNGHPVKSALICVTKSMTTDFGFVRIRGLSVNAAVVLHILERLIHEATIATVIAV